MGSMECFSLNALNCIEVQSRSNNSSNPSSHSYQCKLCKKTFGRTEHLTRHERTRESPSPLFRGKVDRGRYVGETVQLFPLQTRLSTKVTCLCIMIDGRDVLDRHKRLVHTKPEDREPPKKRGRPSRSSDKDSKGSPVPSISPSNERQSPSDSHRHEVDNNPTIDPQLSAHSPIQFPRLPGETPGSSFLTNPFNDNFESGPL